MELSDEKFFALKTEFSILKDEFVTAVCTYKYCCAHFLFAASLFDELADDLKKNKADISGLTLLTKIEFLLRTLALIESIQSHGGCLKPVYRYLDGPAS